MQDNQDNLGSLFTMRSPREISRFLETLSPQDVIPALLEKDSRGITAFERVTTISSSSEIPRVVTKALGNGYNAYDTMLRTSELSWSGLPYNILRRTIKKDGVRGMELTLKAATIKHVPTYAFWCVYACEGIGFGLTRLSQSMERLSSYCFESMKHLTR